MKVKSLYIHGQCSVQSDYLFNEFQNDNMWKKQALVSIRQGRPSIKSFRFNQQKNVRILSNKKTKRHYLELTRINPCFVGHGQDFLLKFVQVALTKDTT